MNIGTYRDRDVTLLLKDITGVVEPLPAEAREPLIQSGVHYSEMLPLEYAPTEEYIRLYELALGRYAKKTALSVAAVSRKVIEKRGLDVVLVSLARAGISAGILIKRYIRQTYGVDVPHYAISIIRGKGIDANAMGTVLSRHPAASIQFVDGWTGKGAIQRELATAMEAYPGVSPTLAVLSDPARITPICGTHEDYLIASSCLNATVSGLISRTFCRDDIIGSHDYHGVACYSNLSREDRTYEFIDTIVQFFDEALADDDDEGRNSFDGLSEVLAICGDFEIDDVNLVKPGIGEATRVLLRRIPWKVLVWSLSDEDNLGHLYQLAEEKGVEVLEYPLKSYRACGLIRKLADS